MSALRRVLAAVGFAGLILAAASGGAAAHGTATYTLRLGSESTNGTPMLATEQFFIHKVQQFTKGQVQIKLYNANQLGSATAMLQQMQAGSLDMVAAASANIATLVPKAQLYSLPYIITSTPGAYQLFSSKVGKSILQSATGTVGLFYSDLGPYELVTKKPIIDPSDMNGLKIRIGADPISIAFASALGADPVSLTFPQVYPGLQQGVLDGAIASMAGLYGAKLFQPAPYLDLTDQQWVAAMTFISRKTMARLPKPLQLAVMRAAALAQVKAKANSIASSNGMLRQLQVAGAHVVQPDKSAFTKIGQTIYSRFSSAIGAANIAAAIKIRDAG